MVLFIVINLVLTLFFLFETFYTDRSGNTDEVGTNPIIPNILLMAVNAGLFTFFIATGGSITSSLFTILMRICFLIEACLLVNISNCLTYYAWKYTNTLTSIAKMILYAFALWIVFFKFKQVSLSDEFGLSVRSDYLFSGDARKFFPWTWVTLYNLVYRFLIPAFMTVVMLCKTEAVGTKLDKFKSYIFIIFSFAFYF